MSLRLKANLILILVFALCGGGGGWYLDRLIKDEHNNQVVQQANILMESALAVRSYTVDLIKPQLDPMLADKFLPQTVPAFAATETFERFRKKFNNFKYKEAVLDPTNPRDLADDQERVIIGKFIDDSALQETSGEIYRNQRRFYYVARPIQIKNPACLACHSTPEVSPPTMRAVYGDKGGYGWKLNQIVGAQIIVVPAYEQDEAARRTLVSISAVFGAIFIVLLLVFNLLLPRQRN